MTQWFSLGWPSISISTMAGAMLSNSSSEYGDEVVLNLVANLLEVDICIIPAFRESSIHQSLGVTIIKCMKDTVHKPLFLAAFSESDFISPHYQSVFPRTESNDLIRRCSLPLPPPSLPPSLPRLMEVDLKTWKLETMCLSWQRRISMMFRSSLQMTSK